MAIARIAEHMIDHAEKHWQDYVDDGIYIDSEQVIESSYMAVTGLEISDEMYDRLKDDKTILGALEAMKEIIQEQMNDYPAQYRYQYGTAEQKLRERGMSQSDFI
jgi:hypothetical protein